MQIFSSQLQNLFQQLQQQVLRCFYSVLFRADSDGDEPCANAADHGGGVSQRDAGGGVDGDGCSSCHLSLPGSAAVYSLKFPEPTTAEEKPQPGCQQHPQLHHPEAGRYTGGAGEPSLKD